MKKRAVTLLTLLAVSASLMACGGSDATESSAENDAEQIEAEVTGQTENADTEEEEVLPEGKYRSELTNELIDESLKDQRPIAVMVDNESIALPHYGLSHADVVYEMMNSTLNGRITRFMALFKDYESVDQIGSIRSVRPTNVILAAEWNAIICHDGGPFYVDEYLDEACSDHFSGTFSRVDNIQSIFFPGTWTRTSPTPMCQRIILPIMREHIISSRMRTTRLISGHLIRMMRLMRIW